MQLKVNFLTSSWWSLRDTVSHQVSTKLSTIWCVWSSPTNFALMVTKTPELASGQILMYHAHKKVVKQSKIWLGRRFNNMPQKQQSYWRTIRVPCPLYIFKLGTDNESTHLNQSHHFHQAAHSVVTCFVKTCLFNICKRLTICKDSLFFKFLCMQNKEFSKSTWIIIRK